ncbi:MAG: 7-dehydrocholesterol reductase [Verrucomicrobia bacterium]|nr:7-dehydrocholesterol reductase [Verrucomicrobiota bacterium]NDE63810.1 7-dehydrocholesterol reductase [Chlamydiota bacterium]
MKNFLRYTVAPLFLMISTPLFAFLFWYTATKLDGSIDALIHLFSRRGILEGLYLIISPVFFGSQFAWSVIIAFAFFEILLMKIIPGKTYHGPTTALGNTPVYKENGLACFVITITLFIGGATFIPTFNPALFYVHMGEFIGAMNLFSLFFCAFLYLKGRYFPSSTDSGISNNLIFDFYWGTELYPRIFGIDLKQWTNCRFGMMGWPLIILSFLYYQNQTYGLHLSMIVSVGLQLLYVTKFFVWEKGYMRSIDIMHDRAGYYICWGCLVWLPVIYTSPALFIVNLPETLNYFTAFIVFVLGGAAILGNFWCDYQRMVLREEYQKTKKLLSVGYIEAISKEGEDCGNKYPLITTGLWGISRNFRYVLELLGAFLWTLPAGFFLPLPWFYFVFLTILLVDRANRNDFRCHRRYKEDWVLYCKQVPYKIIPWIY